MLSYEEIIGRHEERLKDLVSAKGEQLLKLQQTAEAAAGELIQGLPACWRLGDLVFGEDSSESVVPQLVELEHSPSLLLLADESQLEFSNYLVQHIVLDVLQVTDSESCQVTVIDPKVDSFPFLAKLGRPWLKLVHDEQEILATLKGIVAQNARVYADCVTAGYQNLADYNAQQEYPEPYQLVVVNAYQQIKQAEIFTQITSLLNKAKAGCYLLAAGRPVPEKEVYLPDREQELQAKMVEKCLVVELKAGQSLLPADGNWPPEMAAGWISKDFDVLSKVVRTLSEKHQAEHAAANFLRVPIGRLGSRPAMLELGDQVGAYHVLIGGRTGSGKSNLLNNIIVQAGELYTPDELRLYLLDYKGGVEFAPFRDHPNVELLLTDNSQIERGIKVLERMRNLIDKRAQLFLKAGAKNIDTYRKKSGETLARILMIIDEFQVLFSGRFRDKANTYLKDVARRGRSFGLHLILSSQSLKDYALDTDLKNQLGLRIVLRLEANECGGFLDFNNEAPTSLENYHAVLNARNGKPRFNQIIKLNYLPDEALANKIKTLRDQDQWQIVKTLISPATKNEATSEEKETEKKSESGSNAFDSLFNDFLGEEEKTRPKRSGDETFDSLLDDFNL